MGKFAVTQAQYQAVMGKNPSFFEGEKSPVEQVSWHDAIAFCQKLSEKTGKHYRLPSEAEWEYACRTRTTTPFHFGSTLTPELANYRCEAVYDRGIKGESVGETTPVGSFGVANAFGLFDMHGNVWEWCLDHWHSNYEDAPIDGGAWLTDEKDATRLLRGGSWNYSPRNCRSAVRNLSSPDTRDINFGFRVVYPAARTL